MTDQSGLFSGGAIPPEAMGGLPAPIVAVSIGRSTWQGPEDQAPRPAPRYTIAPLHWGACGRGGPAISATALGLTYTIEPAPWGALWRLVRLYDDDEEFLSLEAAKAAAQSDFDRRVRLLISDAMPSARIATPARASTDLLISQLDRRLADHGFAEQGVLRSIVRSIAADLHGLERKSHG